MSMVKFMYLRDLKNPKRVLTVARLIENGQMKMGCAVCRPTVKMGRKVVSQGDEFVKSRGREIALGRMRKAVPFDIGKDERPLDVVMCKLCDVEKPNIISKIVLKHLEERKEKECAS